MSLWSLTYVVALWCLVLDRPEDCHLSDVSKAMLTSMALFLSDIFAFWASHYLPASRHEGEASTATQLYLNNALYLALGLPVQPGKILFPIFVGEHLENRKHALRSTQLFRALLWGDWVSDSQA